MLQPVGKGKIARQEAELAEPIVLCDVSSNRWWSLLYCNTAFSDLTGANHPFLNRADTDMLQGHDYHSIGIMLDQHGFSVIAW